MKKLLKKIIKRIGYFFNRIADREAERVADFYSNISEGKTNKGGEYDRHKKHV
jgi:hypothetical protein